MKLTEKDIEKIALLARLELSEEEKTMYAGQLSVVLDYVEMLNEVDTTMVEETCQVTGLEDVFREDEVEEEDAEEAAEPSGSENISVTEPADKQEVPDLDIDRFANRVVRLINNYQSLLNVEEAILNRAKTFLDENYGDAFVQSFSDTLVQTYGIEVVEFNDVPEVEEDNFAIGAFAGGTGGLGGGGA